MIGEYLRVKNSCLVLHLKLLKAHSRAYVSVAARVAGLAVILQRCKRTQNLAIDLTICGQAVSLVYLATFTDQCFRRQALCFGKFLFQQRGNVFRRSWSQQLLKPDLTRLPGKSQAPTMP